MPSTQSRNVGEQPKNIALDVLESQGGEASSRDIRTALEDEGYKYAPSVVLNELINKGKVERDEDKGVYRLLEEGGNRNQGRSQNSGNRNRERDDRGRFESQDDRGGRSQGRRQQMQGQEGARMMLDRLREINQEERELIDQFGGMLERMQELASAIVGGEEGQGRGNRGQRDQGSNRGRGQDDKNQDDDRSNRGKNQDDEEE